MSECCSNPEADGTSAATGDGAAYDLIVIGAGSAGFSAAITAAEAGARVLLIGHGTIGGTCVNIGCVPSKTMIRAAEALHRSHTAGRFAGVSADARLANWSALQAQKQALVDELRQAKYIDILPSYPNVSYREGRAALISGGVVVAGERLLADKIIIAVGSSPSRPAIPGLESLPYLTSQSALELTDCPRSLIVIGGGVIGCELGQMFARFGARVTIMCRSRLLPDAEPEVSAALEQAFRSEGIDVVCGVHYTRAAWQGAGGGDGAGDDDARTAVLLSASPSEQGIRLAYNHDGEGKEIAAQHLLLAAGRRPNSAGLGLDDLGIATAKDGGIEVDDFMQTTRAGIYAVGDVTGRDMFVYMAAYGARIAAEHAFEIGMEKGGAARRYDSSAMPEVVFTDPQVASVGLSEAQAKAAGLEVRTSLLPLEHVPRALAARDTRGVIKLVADAQTKRLLGAHIIAPEGADAIQSAAIAIKAGFTVDELGAMIFPYLTTVEGLKLATQTFDKDVSKLSCCAG